MINHGYSVKRVVDEFVNRNLHDIKGALDTLAALIRGTPVFVSFLRFGNLGVGMVQLPPPLKADGKTPLRRALLGSTLIAAANLTDGIDIQTSFEQVTTVSDQIRQTSSADFSAKRILFILTHPA